jgi:predicted PurR-regulated permease PerM
MDAFQILVVITSCVLIIFLILSIVLVVQLIQISAKIKKITKSVEGTVESVRETVLGIGRILTPAAITTAVSNWISKLTNRHKEDKNE